MLFGKKQLSQTGLRYFLNRVFALLLMVGLSACGGGSSKSGADPEPQVVGVAEGVALGGNGASSALDNTVNRLPRAVPTDYIQDRLLTTRLVAVLDSSATVDEVNQALADNQASIVTMLEGQPFVTLGIDPVADLSEAQSKAQALKDSGAFVYVRPGRQAPITTNASASIGNRTPALRSLPSYSSRPSAAGYVDHVLSSRFPAAWNLSRAASHNASLVLPHSYAPFEEVGQYDQLPLLSVIAAGTPVDTSDPIFGSIGNLGYQFLGIAAGENLFDGAQNRKLGADPVAIQYLDAYGYHATGMDESDLWAYLYLQWPASGNTVILIDNSYNDPGQDYYSYLDRAWSGFTWRRVAHTIEAQHGPLLMLTPTGNVRNGNTPDDVSFNSAFAVATLPNIQAMVYLSNNASTVDQQAFIDFYNQTASNSPALAAPLENILLVGSSDSNGNESSFSWPGAQVRAVGENVVGPCLVSLNNFCDSNGHTLTSNSAMAATAQVAGLAAYMWHIDNQLSPADLRLRLQQAYSSSDIPGVIDAWTAVLSLDTSLTNATLRKTMLDVSGAGGQPDGVFDEDDVTAFLNAFDAFDGSTAPDWSVYDLNGDGWTNGSGTARMDLDVNDPSAFTTVSQIVADEVKQFNETGVTDTEVLCYYVFSSLYQGVVDDAPVIPDCQAVNQPVSVVTQFSGVNVSADVSLADGGQDQDRFQGSTLSNYSGSISTSANHVATSQEPYTGSAQSSASTTQSVIDNSGSTNDLLLQLNFDGSMTSSADSAGDQADYASRGEGYGDAIVYFDVNDTVYYRFNGTVNGGGTANLPQGQGLGYGYSNIRLVQTSGPEIVNLTYNSDNDGSTMVIDQTGSLTTGSYILRIEAGSISATNNLFSPGSNFTISFSGSVSTSVSFELKRSP